MYFQLRAVIINRHYLLPGMPLSVEIPAPVITMRHLAAFKIDCRRFISSPSAGFEFGTNLEQVTVEPCRCNRNTTKNIKHHTHTRHIKIMHEGYD